MAKKLQDSVPKWDGIQPKGAPSSWSIPALETVAIGWFDALRDANQWAKEKRADCKKVREELRPVLLVLREKLRRQGERNGVDGWQAWFEKHKDEIGCSLRTANRICGDEQEGGDRPKPMALLRELITVISTSSPKAISDKAAAICDQIRWLPPDWKRKEEDAAEGETKKKVGNDERLSLSAPARELGETFDSIKPAAVGDAQQDGQQHEQPCDYTEEEITQMFAKGGN